MRTLLIATLTALTLALTSDDELDTFIRAQMAQRQINGLSIAIIDNGKIEARAYGVVSTGGSPVTTDTLFQAGSISKPVAAVGALKLVEQGTLALDEDVNAKLKTWHVPESNFTTKEKVTLRRILSHSAGLTVHGFPGYAVTEKMPSVPDVLDGRGNTAPIRVDVVPGSLSRYSGGGYTVMQLLVTDVTGKPFPQYMHDAVLAPIGMTRSTYAQPLPADRAAQTASGYYADRSAVEGRWHVYPEMAAAGLWTTPTDLAKFAIEVQQSLAGKSNRVLSQKMTQQLLTEQVQSTGLGFGLSGSGASRSFRHNGRDEGFDAQLIAFAETGQGVVVMINANDNSGMVGRIVNAVARKYNWPSRSSTKPAATERAATTVSLATVAGRYELSNNNMLTLVAQDASLFSDVDGLPDDEFVAMGGDRFGLMEQNVSFTLTRGADGEITGLTWSANGQDRAVPRISALPSLIKPESDPDPSFTWKVLETITALGAGGERARALTTLTAGARNDLVGQPIRELAGVREPRFVASQDVAGRRIERHGGAVAKVLFYKIDTPRGSRYLMVHATADGLITDYDVVDK